MSNAEINKIKSRKNYFVPLLSTLAILSGLVVLLKIKSYGGKEEIVLNLDQTESTKSISTQEEFTIRVDVQGEVNKPGLYEFKEGQVVADVIERAEGYTKDASKEYISKGLNLASKISDQQKIYIPANNEYASSSTSHNADSTVKSQKVNINTASISELDSLAGIGPSYAQKIIDARPFKSIEDIKAVSGIGEATFQKIKDDITI